MMGNNEGILIREAGIEVTGIKRLGYIKGINEREEEQARGKK
jgi:hypothetical protein